MKPFRSAVCANLPRTQSAQLRNISKISAKPRRVRIANLRGVFRPSGLSSPILPQFCGIARSRFARCIIMKISAFRRKGGGGLEFRGRGRLFSYGLAASVTFIWSVTFVSTKYLLGWLEPGEILLYRVAVAYALFVAFSPRPLPRAGLREELRFAAAGLLGVTLYFLCENTALSYSTASNVALIGGTAPLITGIAAHFFTKNEKLRLRGGQRPLPRGDFPHHLQRAFRAEAQSAGRRHRALRGLCIRGLQPYREGDGRGLHAGADCAQDAFLHAALAAGAGGDAGHRPASGAACAPRGPARGRGTS